LVKLIKNNNKLNCLLCDFTDFNNSDYNIELKKLFDSLVSALVHNKFFNTINYINDCITKIEQMINTLNGFQQYVLK
jgi:hypothetical protein